MSEPSLPIPRLLTPLSAAWRRMRAMLFKPTDLNKWIPLGFTAWLAGCGHSNAPATSFQYNMGGSSDADGLSLWEPYTLLSRLEEHLLVAVLVGCLFFALFIGVLILSQWLGARGLFMFTDNAARDRHEVAAPWREYRREAHSYLAWRLLVFLIFGAAVLLNAGLGLAIAWPDIEARTFGLNAILALAVTGTLAFALILLQGYLLMFMSDFILPLMLKHRLRFPSARRLFAPIFREHPGFFLLYGLFKFGLGIAIAIALTIAGLLTCCCLFLLLTIPVINAIVLLPLLLWMRLFALEVLRQFGPDGDLLAETAFPLPPPLPPGPAPVTTPHPPEPDWD